MWWKNFVSIYVSRSLRRIRLVPRNTLLLSIMLPLLMLVGVLGTQLTGTTGQGEHQKAASQNYLTLEETTIGIADTQDTVTSVEDEQPALSPRHEAAAGPQPDDGDPLAVIPAPLRAAAPSTVKRVGIQAGHWKSYELPAELAGLRTSTGTSGGGVPEWQLNLDIARRVAVLLQAEGIEVDVIPATVPPGYQADAFVALHADGDASGRLWGFKLAHSRWSAISEIENDLIAAITKEYQAVTKLRVDPNISRNMTGYYAFNYRRFQHAIAPTTPAVILEMGFMTNASDLQLLLRRQDVVAEGIAKGILRFLNS